MNNSIINIGVNLTRKCNMKCPFCYYTSLAYNKGENKNLDSLDLCLDKFEKIIQDFEIIDNLYLTGGEPMLYPELKKLISKIKSKTRNIYICTNGILVTEAWCDFFYDNNITLVISIKDNSINTFNKLSMIHEKKVKIELYHVLTKSSMPIIKEIPLKYAWCEKIRLLFETSSDPEKVTITPQEWFALLKISSYYLQPIIDKVEAEIGYLPKKHSIAQRADKGAVKRIIIDYNAKIYPCPLIVEKNNGVDNISKLEGCKIEKCPVIKDINSELYQQICPFNIVSLEKI